MMILEQVARMKNFSVVFEIPERSDWVRTAVEPNTGRMMSWIPVNEIECLQCVVHYVTLPPIPAGAA